MALTHMNKIKNDDYENTFVELVQENIRIILSFIIITNFIVIFLLKFSIKLKNKLEAFCGDKSEPNNKEALILIAHPDDEIMFFAPTLRVLIRNKIKIRILCLSNGNFDNLGKLREIEFENVCKSLKIEDRTILDVPDLQDDINKKWESKYIASILTNYFEKDDNYDKIKNVITFDELGVTKHPNHISCSEGLIEFLKLKKEIIMEKKIDSYLLDSHNPISQYSFIIPFIFFYFKEFGFFSRSFLNSWRLMKHYRSQFTFLRKLHIMFSAYTYFNTFTKIEFNS